MAKKSTPHKPELSRTRKLRQSRVAVAAEAVFRRDGFRATTMEAIAVAAGVSKATLYSYFTDKEAVFSEVMQNFASRIRSAFIDTLRADGAIEVRIAHALVEKHTMVFDAVRRTENTSDLLMAGDRIAQSTIRELDEDLIAEMASDLLKNGYKDGASLARLIFAAADGIGRAAMTKRGLERDIRLLVQRLLSR